MIKGDPALRLKFKLALTLSKTIAEIDQMTETEFNGWVAYLSIKSDKENG
jgi:hypothetical protein